MQKQKTIYLTVTNDLNQDQRMHRICTSLCKEGHKVILVGRVKKESQTLLDFPFDQRRLFCFFEKGFFFYAEFNIRLFLFLLFKKIDILYSVDLDTIAVGGMIKLVRKKSLLFDAHEYFEETPEVYRRSAVKFVWSKIGYVFVPFADKYITVNESLGQLLGKRYKRSFDVIYNAPTYYENVALADENIQKPYILYQGVLNKGRGISEMIDAMEIISNVELWLIGEGDLSSELRIKASKSSAMDRIKFVGWLSPKEIKAITRNAILGINLLDGSCKNYYYSLANKFFDYMHNGVPSVNMDFPEYRNIINQFSIGVLVHDLTARAISEVINNLLQDRDSLDKMHHQCYLAAKEFNWQNEEKKITEIINSL
jgi:glycosyltransferase involved in cell wall biosynthesis